MRRLNLLEAGFTLIEALVALCIAAILLSVGVPQMTDWLATNRAAGVVEFYAEGLRQANEQAILHNSASRLVLTVNPSSGQYDWRVDICFPAPGQPCSDGVGNWSTANAPSPDDPAGASGFKSIVRGSDGQPKPDKVRVTITPTGADRVYFTSLGWVDQNINPRLSRITIEPAHAGQFPSTALTLSLAGVAAKCKPGAATGDSRQCPE